MRTKPFFKWAGGKFRLLEKILPHLPGGARLVEPFVGSGAVFLNTEYKEYLLCDANADLILFYQELAKSRAEFVDYCRGFFQPDHNTSEAFYRLRERFNALPPCAERAAIFLYLNRHGFNGLIRYNQRGLFNTPFGTYRSPYFPQKEMQVFLGKLERSSFVFRHADFRETFAGVKKGDVVYCDPPYVPLSLTANFTSYTGGGFGLPEQRELAACALRAHQGGIPVVISNHDTEITRILYPGAKLDSFTVQRFISCNGEARARAPELLAVYT